MKIQIEQQINDNIIQIQLFIRGILFRNHLDIFINLQQSTLHIKQLKNSNKEDILILPPIETYITFTNIKEFIQKLFLLLLSLISLYTNIKQKLPTKQQLINNSMTQQQHIHVQNTHADQDEHYTSNKYQFSGLCLPNNEIEEPQRITQRVQSKVQPKNKEQQQLNRSYSQHLRKRKHPRSSSSQRSSKYRPKHEKKSKQKRQKKVAQETQEIIKSFQIPQHNEPIKEGKSINAQSLEYKKLDALQNYIMLKGQQFYIIPKSGNQVHKISISQRKCIKYGQKQLKQWMIE